MSIKRSLTLLITVLSVLLLVAFAGVNAHDSTTNDDVVDEDSTTTQSTGAETEDDRQQTREQRLDEIKQRRQAAVDEARQQLLARKCFAAQDKISNHATNVAAGQDSRSAAYNNIADKLSNIISRLAGLEVDTSEVENLVTVFNTMMATFMSNVDDYEVVLGDLANMDCESDVVAFQAALEEARSMASSLKTEAVSLHSYLKEDVKTALRALISQLQTDAGEEA